MFEQTQELAAGRFGAAHAADYDVALPLATLMPGEYLLRVSAALDRRVVGRDVRLTVTR